MSPEHLKQAWQTQGAQTRLLIDTERLIAEVRRNRRWFAASIFWRDVREVGVSLLLIPVWIYLGVAFALPWTWHLMVPAVVWIAGFMLLDRLRHRRRPPEASESLLACVENSLAQVAHQIWLLRNIFWWYLLPLAVPMMAFLIHVGWRSSAGEWATFSLAIPLTVVGAVFAGIYWLNQAAVRSSLEPRRGELQALLASLKESTPEAGEVSK